MATCCDPHLGNLQANIIHTINYNVNVDRLRPQSVLGT